MKYSSQMENTFRKNAFEYLEHLKRCFTITNLEAVEELALELLQAWVNGRSVFLVAMEAAQQMQFISQMTFITESVHADQTKNYQGYA